jgi:hypothetical protein
MKRLFFISSILASLAVSGCVRQERKIEVAFSASEHEPYLKEGTGIVTGQAFLRQQGGGVVRCSGEEVVLLPATSFFREIVQTYKSGFQPSTDWRADERYKKLPRKVFCDADGKFKIEKLPSGSWYILSQVRWAVGNASQGGQLLEEVQIKANTTTDVILSDRNRV